MKNKLCLVGLFFLFFALTLPSRVNLNVYARQIADVDTTIGESQVTDTSEAEYVTVPLSDKVILKDGTPVKDVFNSTDDMVNLLVKVVFVAAGLFLFFMIIGAGFSMIQGESKDKDKAKTTMTSAAIGFIIMFAAYWIMQIIQILTGVNMGF